MGDIRKGATVNQCRIMLKRLDKIGFDRVFEQCSDRPLNFEIADTNWKIVLIIGDNHPRYSRFQFIDVFG